MSDLEVADSEDDIATREFETAVSISLVTTLPWKSLACYKQVKLGGVLTNRIADVLIPTF